MNYSSIFANITICMALISCDSAAYISASITIPHKLALSEIAANQDKLVVLVHSAFPDWKLEKQEPWRIDGKMADITPSSARINTGGRSKIPEVASGLELETAYNAIQSHIISFWSNGNELRYYYSAVPGVVSKETKSTILEITNFTAKQYNLKSFKICLSEDSVDCYVIKVK